MPSTTTEEDRPFSDFVLRWLDEGDRLHENPTTAGPVVDLRRKRSWRLLTTAASVVVLALVVRFVIRDMNRPIENASQPVVAAPSIAAPSVAAPVVAAAPAASGAAEPAPVPAPEPVAPGVAPGAAPGVAPVLAPAEAPPPVAAVAVTPAPAAPTPAIKARAIAAVAPAAVVPPVVPALVAETVAPSFREAPSAVASKAEAVLAVEPAVAAAAASPVAPAIADEAKAVDAPLAPTDAPAAVVAGAPVDFESLAARCREATARGRWGAARSACTAAREARPDSPDVLTRLAEIALNRGQGRQALRLANSALAADPAFADAYVIVGSVEQESNRVEQARAAYERYLQLAPSGRFASDLRAILATP